MSRPGELVFEDDTRPPDESPPRFQGLVFEDDVQPQQVAPEIDTDLAFEDDPLAPQPPPDEGGWIQSFKTGLAGFTEATLGMAKSILETPRTASRISRSLEESWNNTVIDWYAGVNAREDDTPEDVEWRKQVYERNLNPFRFTTAVFDALGEDIVLPSLTPSDPPLRLGMFNSAADELGRAMEILPEVSPTFRRLGMKGEEADAAAKALIEGNPELMKKVALDPEAWSAFLSNGIPSLFAAWKSGGSIPFMAWLEGMDAAQSAQDFERRTGVQMSDSEFATATLTVGAANAFLEKFGLDTILGKYGKTRVGQLVAGFVGEGGTETLQELTNNTAALLYDPELQDQAREAIDEGEWEPFLKRMTQGVVPAMMGGTALGGTASSARVALESMANRNRAERVRSADITPEQAAEAGIEEVPVTFELLDRVSQGQPLTDSESYTILKNGFGRFANDERVVLVKSGLDKREELRPAPIGEHIVMEGDEFTVAPVEVEDVVDDVESRVTFSKRPLYSKKQQREMLDRAAGYAQVSDRNELAEPSDAQIEAGNYRKGHVRMQGLELSIESPKGSVRKGRDFEQEMADHYGYIRGTVGRDKDHIDTFVGPNAYSQQVFVVNQLNREGEFDEHKVMLGYTSQAAAEEAYLRNYPKGWKGMGEVVALGMDDFKAWLGSDRTKEPIVGRDPRDEVQDLKPAVKIEAAPVAGKESRESASNAYEEQTKQGPYTTRDGRTVKLTRVGLKKARSHAADPNVLAVLPHIGALIENSVPVQTVPRRRTGKGDSISAYHHYAGKVMIGGKYHFVKVTLREARDGSVIFYDADVTPGDQMLKPPKGKGFNLAAWWQRSLDMTPKAKFKTKPAKTNAGAGVNRHELRAAVNVFARYFKDAPDLEVVEAFEDLPPHIKIRVEAKDRGRITGVFDQDGMFEAVYIIANNVESYQMGVETLLHEYVGHYGLRAVVGSKYDETMDAIIERFEKEVRESARVQGLDWNDTEQRRVAAEEFVAYTAQRYLNKEPIHERLLKLVRQLIEEIRRVVALAMGKPDTFTERQLFQLITRAYDYVHNPGGYAREQRRGIRRQQQPPTYFSQLYKFIADDPAKSRTVEDWLRHIGTPKDAQGKGGSGAVGNGKIKEEEVRWSGVRQWIETATWGSTLPVVDNVWASPASSTVPAPVLAAWQRVHETRIRSEQSNREFDLAKFGTPEHELAQKRMERDHAAADAALDEWAKISHESKPQKLSKDMVLAYLSKHGVQIEVTPAEGRKQLVNRKEMADWDAKYAPKPEEPEKEKFDLVTDDERQEIEEEVDNEYGPEPDEVNRHSPDEEEFIDGEFDEDNFMERFSEHIENVWSTHDFNDVRREIMKEHGYIEDLDDAEHDRIQELINEDAEERARMDAEGELTEREKELLREHEDDWSWDGTTLETIDEKANEQYREQLEQDEYQEFRDNAEKEATRYIWERGRWRVTRDGGDEDNSYVVYDTETGDESTYTYASDAGAAIKEAWEALREDFRTDKLREKQKEHEEEEERLEQERLAEEEILAAERAERAALEAAERERLGLAPVQDPLLLEEGGQQLLIDRTPEEQALLPPPPPPEPLPPPPRPEPRYEVVGTPKYEQYRPPGGGEYHEWSFNWSNAPGSVEYQQGHWSQQKNQIAWSRWDIRKDMDGNDAIYIDEFQSDWHKALIKHGVRVPRETFEREADELQQRYRDNVLPELIRRVKMWKLTPDLAAELGTGLDTGYRYEVNQWVRSFIDSATRVAQYERNRRADMIYDFRNKLYREEDVLREKARRGEIQHTNRDFQTLEKMAAQQAALATVEIPDDVKDVTWEEWVDKFSVIDRDGPAVLGELTRKMRMAQIYVQLASLHDRYIRSQYIEENRVGLEPKGIEEMVAQSNTTLQAAYTLQDRYTKSKHGTWEAPFANTWPVVLMKQMIREAVRRGHKKIFFSVGEVHGIRWSGGALIPGFNWKIVDAPPSGWGNLDPEAEAKAKADGPFILLTPREGSSMRPATVPLKRLHQFVGADGSAFVKTLMDTGLTDGIVDAKEHLGRNGIPYPHVEDNEASKRMTGSREIYNVITPKEVNRWLKPFKTTMKMGRVKMRDAYASLSRRDVQGSSGLKTFALVDPNNIYSRWTARALTLDESKRFGLVGKDVTGSTFDWWAMVNEHGEVHEPSITMDRSVVFSELGRLQRQNAIEGFEAWEIEITPELSKAALGGFPLFMKKYPSKQLNDALRWANKNIGPRGPGGLRKMQDRVTAIVGITNKAAKLEQAFVDQFAGIKYALLEAYGEELPAERSGYKQAHFTTGIDSQMYAFLNFGLPQWKDGITQIKEGTKGLLEILEPVAANIDEWGMWMAARRADRLMGEGREHLFGREEIDGLLELSKYHPEFVDVAVEFAKWKASFLDWAQEAGVIDPTTRQLWENADYVPFYRLKADELGGSFSRSSAMGVQGIANQYNPIKRLRGGTQPLGNILENIVMNFTHLASTAMKNRAAALTIDNLKETGLIEPVKGSEFLQKEVIDMGDLKRKLKAAGVDWKALDEEALFAMRQMWTVQPPKGDDIVSILVGGKKKYYHVKDELLFRALTAINTNAFNSTFARFMMAPFRGAKRFVTSMITLDPGFMAANLVRDTLSSFIISRHANTPRFDQSLLGAWKALTDDKDMVSLMASGAAFYAGYVNALDPAATAKAVKRAVREKGFRNTLLTSPKRLFDAYQKLGSASENASRIGMAYIPARKKGASVGEAAWQAKDLMNFAKHGDNAVMQFLIQTVPFLNARIQGLVRTGQRFKEAPGTTALKGLLLMTAALALWLSNKDDERYKELPEEDKDLYFHFWIGDQHYRLPKPFEVGMIFGTIPERVMEYFYSNENDAGKLAIDRLKFVFDQVFMVYDPVTIVPMPALVEPLVEVNLNQNFFFKAPIVPEYMQDIALVKPDQVYDDTTSPAMRELAGVMPRFLPNELRNPMMLEHLMQGYGGTLTGYGVMMADDMVRSRFDYPPRPALAWSQLPLVSRFYRGTEPPRRTNYENVMYEVRQYARGVERAVTQMENRELQEESEAFLEERSGFNRNVTNLEVIEASRDMESLYNSVRLIRREMTEIWNDPDMAPDEKLMRLNQLYRDKADEAREAYRLRPGAGPQPAPIGQIIDNIRGLRPAEAADLLREQGLNSTAELVASLPRATSKNFAKALRDV